MSTTEPLGCALAHPDALEDPFPLLDRLRREDPVHWSEPLQAWVLTRYDDVARGLRDPRLSSRRTDGIVEGQLRNGDRALAEDFARVVGGMMVMKDGAEHLRLRRLANRGFLPELLDGLRPVVRRLVDQMLDRVAPAGRMDVVADLADPLPAAVIGEMFAIPAEDRALFRRWSEDASRFFGGAVGDPAAAARAANEGMVRLKRYFLGMLEERQRRPGRDLMSLFLAGQAEGKLTAEEVCCQCILLLIAGHATVIDQLGNGVHALLQRPRELRRLRADPSLYRTAVEEVLRYDPAVMYVHRIAREDVEVGGRRLRAGQLVFLGVGAANRDPQAFEDPGRFDVARAGNYHLTFGAGPHLCLGAGLARRQLEVALSALFRRLPGLRLDDATPPRRRCADLVFRGFASLPVVF